MMLLASVRLVLLFYACVLLRAQEEIDYDSLEKNCPRGYYHNTEAGTLLRRAECKPCPRGRYAVSTGSTETCSGRCPAGRYGPNLASKSIDECRYCPPGTYGSEGGLTTARCSGQCPEGFYGRTFGETSENSCIECPTGYRGQQCNFSKRDPAGVFTDKSVIDYLDGDPEGRLTRYKE